MMASDPVTKFTDLNDKCLIAVFQHLNPIKLAIVADVCIHLRCITKKFLTEADLLEDRSKWLAKHHSIRFDRSILNASRVLRLFAPHITHFEYSNEIDMHIICQSHQWKLKVEDDFGPKFIELMARHCSDSLQTIRFSWCDFLDDTTTTENVVFRSVQKLDMHNVSVDAKIWQAKMLPIIFPAICQLDFSYVHIPTYDFEQHFPKLSKVSIIQCGWMSCAVEGFLKSNRQLKELHIDDVGYRFFRSIGQYATNLEKLDVTVYDLCPDLVSYTPELRYFDRLTNLRQFSLYEDHRKSSSMTYVMRDNIAAEIPLDKLVIGKTKSDSTESLLMSEIVEMKTLKSLHLWFSVDAVKDIHSVCTQLDNLIDLHVSYDAGALLATDLLEIVRCGKKLQKLSIRAKVTIDADTYDALTTIVRTREEKASLKIQFCSDLCKIHLPAELTEIAGNIVSIVFERNS